MDKIEFNILKAEIDAQIKEIEKIFIEIEDRKDKAKKDKINLESLAYKLHNLYCAFEDLFKIIAEHFENKIIDLDKYHRELLFRMSLDIEGGRPKVIREDTYKMLDELRAFRHYFRHAYSYEINYDKVKIVLNYALKLKEIYKDDIKKFLEIIDENLSQLIVDKKENICSRH